jgi:hypothetical protein
MSLLQGPGGGVLESEGQPVAWVVPANTAQGVSDEPWSEAKNQRRWDLLDRKYTTGLTRDEAFELARLQRELYAEQRRVAPLPLDEARRLHQELLKKAHSAQPKS